MGNTFSGSGSAYNLDDHGQSSRALYDEYLASDDKFLDLSSKVVAITGTSTKSIGFHIAEIAVRKQAKVLMLCNRDSSSAQKGAEELKALVQETKSSTKIEVVTCDLQDFASVRSASQKINAIANKNKGLDILVCNAGVMALKDIRTQDGFEIQMQTNQLSHFLLTQGVWKSIVQAAKSRGDARVVTHSSSARYGPGGNLYQDFFKKSQAGTLGGDSYPIAFQYLGKRGNWTRYHESKLANANFAMALHDKIQASGLKGNIKAGSADPGLATSNLQVTTMNDGGMPSWMAKVLGGNGQSPADGSLPIGLAAFGKSTKSGSFFMPSEGGGLKGPPIATIQEGVAVKKGEEKLVVSPENKENVWKWCEEALDMKFVIE